MRAAIYARYSTDKQTESSVADQLRVCTEHAERHGFTVALTFRDEGISGAATGNRPGFSSAAAPDLGEKLYQHFSAALRGLGLPVENGEFGADMAVSLLNDGPVTIWMDTSDRN